MNEQRAQPRRQIPAIAVIQSLSWSTAFSRDRETCAELAARA